MRKQCNHPHLPWEPHLPSKERWLCLECLSSPSCLPALIIHTSSSLIFCSHERSFSISSAILFEGKQIKPHFKLSSLLSLFTIRIVALEVVELGLIIGRKCFFHTLVQQAKWLKHTWANSVVRYPVPALFLLTLPSSLSHCCPGVCHYFRMEQTQAMWRLE